MCVITLIIFIYRSIPFPPETTCFVLDLFILAAHMGCFISGGWLLVASGAVNIPSRLIFDSVRKNRTR